MLNKIILDFPKVKDADRLFSLSANNKYYIQDYKKEERTVLVNENEKWDFCLETNRTHSATLIDNERAIMTSINTKKCDWICFDSNKFFFLEAKKVNARSRKKARQDALKKFEASINFYHLIVSKINDLFETVAILSFDTPARLKNSASFKQKKAEFKRRFNVDYDETVYIKL